MEKINRLPTDKPYPARVWLAKPAKTVMILGGMAAGLVALVGALIEDVLPIHVTVGAAVACVLLLGVYFIIATVGTHRRERFAEQCMALRKARIAEFEAMGFAATRKFIGSSRIFAVDEKRGEWFYIDYFNDPEKAKLHALSAITGIAEGTNGEWIPPGHRVLLSNGKELSKKDNDGYYSKVGVLLTLSEPDCPVVFINCFKTENDADLITRYLVELVGG